MHEFNIHERVAEAQAKARQLARRLAECHDPRATTLTKAWFEAEPAAPGEVQILAEAAGNASVAAGCADAYGAVERAYHDAIEDEWNRIRSEREAQS